MLRANLALSCVDAVGWSESITVTVSYDGSGALKTTGSATFHYTRAKLTDLLTRPDLPFEGQLTDFLSDDGTNEALLKKFVAVQPGVGSCQGWMVVFGGQPVQKDAFTFEIDEPPQPPYIGHMDAGCNVQATCAQITPGRNAYGTASLPTDGSAPAAFLGLNVGLQADAKSLVKGAAYEVEQIFAGQAADADHWIEAIPPVYRVTLPNPTEALAIAQFSISLNGQEYTVGDDGTNADEQGNDGSQLPNLIFVAIIELNNYGFLGTIIQRSPGVCEVWMENFGDVLSAGLVSYYTQTTLESTIVVNGLSKTVDSPFPMAGQSFTFGPDTTGLTVEISL